MIVGPQGLITLFHAPFILAFFHGTLYILPWSRGGLGHIISICWLLQSTKYVTDVQ